MDDLVKSGKLRYVGISDAPAWKVAQAQVVSHFRGWNPLIALQIEYSLPDGEFSSGLSIRISVPGNAAVSTNLGCGHTPHGRIVGISYSWEL